MNQGVKASWEVCVCVCEGKRRGKEKGAGDLGK